MCALATLSRSVIKVTCGCGVKAYSNSESPLSEDRCYGASGFAEDRWENPMSKVTKHRIVAGALISISWSAVLFVTLALSFVLNR